MTIVSSPIDIIQIFSSSLSPDLVLAVLPEELLYEILYYVLENSEYMVRVPRRSPILIIRSVCRTFRIIADELPFWYQDDFDFLSLLPRTRIRQGENFLKDLFIDHHLVKCLEWKKHWYFQSIGALRAVIEGVYSFQKNVISIKLGFHFIEQDLISPTSTDLAIRYLAPCRHLISLELGRGCSSVDLNEIQKSCIALENLVVRSPLMRSETSKLFSNLPTMHIQSKQDDFSHNASFLVPLNFTITLTSLTIDFWPHSRSIYDAESLDAFINLICLHIRPLTDDICEFLLRSGLRLVTFSTTTFGESKVMRIIDILSASCLREVENFAFKLDTNNVESSVTRSIVEAISNLVFIQRLKLEMDFDLE